MPRHAEKHTGGGGGVVVVGWTRLVGGQWVLCSETIAHLLRDRVTYFLR